jgi:hypothetical protein
VAENRPPHFMLTTTDDTPLRVIDSMVDCHGDVRT